MPTVTKINSGKGLVSFSKEELIDLDLTKWIRADSKGIGNRCFVAVQPIEEAAAKVYKEKYPSTQIKIAEKCFARVDGSVDVVLRVAQDISDGYYKKHPTKLTFLGDASAKETQIGPTANEIFESKDKEIKKKSSKVSLPIDFLEENIDKLTDDEKRQIFAELGGNDADIFLNDLRLTVLGASVLPDKLATELLKESENVEDLDEDDNKTE